MSLLSIHQRSQMILVFSGVEPMIPFKPFIGPPVASLPGIAGIGR